MDVTPHFPIYLDYGATTPVDPRVVDAMIPWLREHFGNPASRSHAWGWEAEEAVEKARGYVAELIGADPREIVWTSGATESNNLALKGAAQFYKGKGKQGADPGYFNPLTHEYQFNASPRDLKRSTGRRPPAHGLGSLTPRLNPLTQKLDPLNSTRAALRDFDPRTIDGRSLRVTSRVPISPRFGLRSSRQGVPWRV